MTSLNSFLKPAETLVIPKPLKSDRNLPDNVKIFGAELLQWIKDGKNIEYSPKYLAEILGLSVPLATKAVKLLCIGGYLQVQTIFDNERRLHRQMIKLGNKI